MRHSSLSKKGRIPEVENATLKTESEPSLPEKVEAEHRVSEGSQVTLGFRSSNDCRRDVISSDRIKRRSLPGGTEWFMPTRGTN